MKAGHWVAMIVVFVVGVILGFGIGSNPSKVAGLENTIQQLTKENAELKSQVATIAAQSAPASQAPGVAPATIEQPKKP